MRVEEERTLILVLITAILLLMGSSQATTLTVCPTGCDYVDIQKAVEAANPGDEINIIRGIYDKVVLDKPLKVRGGEWGPLDFTKIPRLDEIYKCGYPLEINGNWKDFPKEIDECISPPCKECQQTEPSPPVLSESTTKQIANSISDSEPQTAADWNNRGLVLYNQGKCEEAIQAYDRSIEINPQNAYAWSNKGIAFYDLGKYDEAIQAYDKAIEIYPQFADAWSNKGVALYNLGRYDAAIQACDKALEINSQHASAWYNKGNPLAQQGKYDEALHAYNKAIEINPQYANAWYNKGVVLMKLDRTTEAEAAFAKAKEVGYPGNSSPDNMHDLSA